jgi:hypothetical protein
MIATSKPRARDLDGYVQRYSSGLAAGPLENFHQIFATHTVAFGLADVVDDDRASLATRLAATALLLRFEVEQFASLQVTGVSRFRD